MADTSSAEGAPETAADLTIFVQNLLEQMQQRFNQMSSTIISRIDDMGGRIDELEKSIGDLMAQAGIEADTSQPEADAK